jgi:hypothetical protein
MKLFFQRRSVRDYRGNPLKKIGTESREASGGNGKIRFSNCSAYNVHRVSA